MDMHRVLETATAVASDVLAKNAEAVDREARWPQEGIAALLDAGLGGLVVPEDAGGLGYGLLALTQVCETLGRQCASTAICYGMHGVGAAVIAAKATPQQRERYLEPIARGEHLTTLALSEPGSGSAFWIPSTALAARDDGTYVVRGAKVFVTNGSHADSYVISTVAADPAAPPGEFSCAILPASSEGLVWGGGWQGFGMRGNDARRLEIDDVVITRREILGEEGEEIWYVFNVVAPFFLAAMSGTYLGVAQTCLEETVHHLGGRRFEHTGSTLGRQPVVQHRLGQLYGVVERARRLTYEAAMAAESGAENALPLLCSAKAEVGDTVVAVANEAMTLMGGIAYGENSRIARSLRDARAAPVMSPSTDLLRTWVGRYLLGLPLLTE
ncbi:MAG TPA: acyl-CoA dehydrogenase family protein [Actinomycetota bacterium]|nr:acyl-CoA dehydrogenase family protein [Actinomycetota bacterium]